MRKDRSRDQWSSVDAVSRRPTDPTVAADHDGGDPTYTALLTCLDCSAHGEIWRENDEEHQSLSTAPTPICSYPILREARVWGSQPTRRRKLTSIPSSRPFGAKPTAEPTVHSRATVRPNRARRQVLWELFRVSISWTAPPRPDWRADLLEAEPPCLGEA